MEIFSLANAYIEKTDSENRGKRSATFLAVVQEDMIASLNFAKIRN